MFLYIYCNKKEFINLGDNIDKCDIGILNDINNIYHSINDTKDGVKSKQNSVESNSMYNFIYKQLNIDYLKALDCIQYGGYLYASIMNKIYSILKITIDMNPLNAINNQNIFQELNIKLYKICSKFQNNHDILREDKMVFKDDVPCKIDKQSLAALPNWYTNMIICYLKIVNILYLIRK